MSDQSTVLVVEDEPDVATTYELWLRDDHEVLVANDGEAALELADDDVDVVLLDRMMPGMSGDEVLAALHDRGLDCRVAMVTAVDPDFDILEMGFDDYVTKPPTREELQGMVGDLLKREDHADRVREYYSLLAKRAVLASQKSAAALEHNEEFAALEADIAALEADLEGDADRLLDDAAFLGELRDLVGEEGDG